MVYGAEEALLSVRSLDGFMVAVLPKGVCVVVDA